MIVGAQARFAIVGRPCCERRSVERADLLAVPGREGQMQAARGLAAGADPELAAVIAPEARVFAKLHDDANAERRQRRGVEGAARLEVGNGKSEMIEHFGSPLVAFCTALR